MIFTTKYLHSLVYIVADEPTEQNIRKDIPLVGTQSYKTLLKWIGDMDVDITRCRLFNQIDCPFDNALSRTTLNTAIELGQIKVVALGQKAAQYLGKVGIIEFYILPHSSGLNRLLNDQEYVNNKLQGCKTYIYQGVLNGQQECTEGVEEDLQPEQSISSNNESGQLE